MFHVGALKTDVTYYMDNSSQQTLSASAAWTALGYCRLSCSNRLVWN